MSQASSLPDTWSSLTSLQVLRFSGNSGTAAPFSALPPTWSQLNKLQQLSISNASFSLTGLPQSWSNMTSLRSFKLRNVTFLTAGQLLPSSWGGLSSLQTLEFELVSGLAGTLPSAWQQGLPALQQLHLNSVSNLTASLSDYLVLVNQAFRFTGANGTWQLSTLKLEGLGLSGGIPAAMWNATG